MSNKYPVISEFGMSAELTELCGKKRGLKNEIESWCHTLTFSIIYAAQHLKDTYDKHLEDYNNSAKNGNYLYLTPNIKVTTEPKRTYLVLRWARLVNGSYIGQPSKPHQWSVREISRAGKLHYSENDFKPFFYNIDQKMFNLALEIEESFRFLRMQYLLVGDIYKLARKLELSQYQKLLIKENAELNDDEIKLKDYCLKSLCAEAPKFNPLNLPKSISLFDFEVNDLSKLNFEDDEDKWIF
jgi:hypothetical protein